MVDFGSSKKEKLEVGKICSEGQLEGLVRKVRQFLSLTANFLRSGTKQVLYIIA